MEGSGEPPASIGLLEHAGKEGGRREPEGGGERGKRARETPQDSKGRERDGDRQPDRLPLANEEEEMLKWRER